MEHEFKAEAWPFQYGGGYFILNGRAQPYDERNRHALAKYLREIAEIIENRMETMPVRAMPPESELA
jgi:hypothetical protein